MTRFVDTGYDPSETSSDGFDIYTRRCDTTRAELHVAGDVGDAAAVVLEHVFDGHRRAGRRFLRLDVDGLRSLGDAALAVIAAAHESLLARKGTLILVAVHPEFEARLRAAVPASPLLMLPASAAERGGFGMA